jgi:hypothetical protein
MRFDYILTWFMYYSGVALWVAIAMCLTAYIPYVIYVVINFIRGLGVRKCR